MRRLLFAFLLVLALGTGFFQQYRLSQLRRQLDSRASEDSSKIPRPVSGSRVAIREPEAPIDMHSMAGRKSIPELKSLIAEIVSEGRKLSEGKRYMVNLPPGDSRVQRLQELLSGLGSGAALELIQSLDDLTLKVKIRTYYASSNPQEYFLLGRSDGKDTPIGFWSLRDWGYVDPANALQWYRESRNRGEKIATGFDMELCATAMEARVAPGRAVTDLKALLEQKPDHLAESEIREIAQTLCYNFRSPEEYSSFLVALKASEKETPHLEEVRAQIAYWLISGLREKPFAEALPMVEKALTYDDKLKYIREKSYLFSSDPSEIEAWIHWVCSLDIPSDDRHPLVIYAGNQAQRRTAPEWVDLITASEVRNEAIASFALAMDYRDPLLASQWAAKLPDGKLRQNAVQKIAKAWQQTDHAAADAFLKKESAQAQK